MGEGIKKISENRLHFDPKVQKPILRHILSIQFRNINLISQYFSSDSKTNRFVPIHLVPSPYVLQ